MIKDLKLSAILMDSSKQKTIKAFQTIFKIDAKKDKIIHFTAEIPDPFKWSAESPYLYNLLLCLRSLDEKIKEYIPLKIGFRKVEIKMGSCY